MTDRIDHVGEAVALLGAADSDVSRNHPIQTGEEKADLLANAQVHATLALVEQQRIANLVGYVHLLEVQYAEAARNSAEFDWSTREDREARHALALAQIREGLGL